MGPATAAPGTTAAEIRSRITFRQDRMRGACAGVLESGLMTFGLVVAIRYFEVPQIIKGLVAGGNALGLLLTPVSLYFFARFGWSASRAASRNFATGAVFLLLASLAPNKWTFIPVLVLSSMVLSQQAPLLVHIYTSNYAPSRRGRMLSTSIILSLVTAILFTTGGGWLLDHDLSTFRWLFVAMALAAMVAAFAVSAIPSEPMVPRGGRNPLDALRYIREDKVFGWMLLVWMIMGFGNLMVLPLRVEYMANPVYGIDATNTQIAIATAVIPSIVRLATTHLWGRIFDRHNFFIIRAVLNGIFLLALLTFFFTSDLTVLYVGGGLFGMAMAGGNIAWNLWVTKFAPPDRAADYMSVHTFLTGVRGVLAPFVGFYCIGILSPTTTSWIAAGLLATSIIMIDPLRRKHRGLG